MSILQRCSGFRRVQTYFSLAVYPASFVCLHGRMLSFYAPFLEGTLTPKGPRGILPVLYHKSKAMILPKRVILQRHPLFWCQMSLQARSPCLPGFACMKAGRSDCRHCLNKKSLSLFFSLSLNYVDLQERSLRAQRPSRPQTHFFFCFSQNVFLCGEIVKKTLHLIILAR